MSKVSITKSKLDNLAVSISTKSGASLPLTLDQMKTAVDNMSGVTLQSKSATPTTSAQTITPDVGYDGLSSVTISAMPNGTAGTPTATKGAVNNHAISVTPSVTNTTGYITGGTKTGTGVSVAASELVSGTLSITSNNTYDVTDYASVNVNVSGGGGSSNIVEGTFTTPSTAGSSKVSTGYTGTGYPISCIVVVDGGAYVSGTTWYTTIQRYAVGMWTMTKSDFSTTPAYSTSGAENQGVICAIYKNSTSSSTSYSRTSAMTTKVFSSNNASNTAANTIKLMPGNELSYYTNTSSYGLLPNTTYRYIITYSS